MASHEPCRRSRTRPGKPVISAVLAAIAALAWGGSDYCGGKAARHAAALAVTMVSQVLGLPALLLCALLLSGRPDGADLAWGAGAGCPARIVGARGQAPRKTTHPSSSRLAAIELGRCAHPMVY